jgi:hypothetical protein
MRAQLFYYPGYSNNIIVSQSGGMGGDCIAPVCSYHAQPQLEKGDKQCDANDIGSPCDATDAAACDTLVN